MKKTLLVVLFVLVGTTTVLGCASLKKNYDYYSLCMNDSSCSALVAADVNTARVVTARAVEAVPQSRDWMTLILTNLVSTVVGIFSGVRHGKKLKKG